MDHWDHNTRSAEERTPERWPQTCVAAGCDRAGAAGSAVRTSRVFRVYIAAFCALKRHQGSRTGSKEAAELQPVPLGCKDALSHT